MKKFIKTLALVLCLSMVTPSVVPNVGIESVQAATKVKLSKSKTSIIEGDSEYISIIIDGFQLIDDGFVIKWSSSNKKVATVNKRGLVKGISCGTATIKAKYNKKTYKCKVTVKSKNTKHKVTKPTIKSNFNADIAKENITFTPISADNTLYRVTSTYDIPTLVTVNYKIIDKEGVTVIKSSSSVVATALKDSYLHIPQCTSDNTMQLSYSYKETNEIPKDKYDKLFNSIQITKFENISGNTFFGFQNTGSFTYSVYIKNISNEKIKGRVGFLTYDDKGELLPYQAGSEIIIDDLDPDEIKKYTIEVAQGIKDIDNPFDGMVNVGGIKFYIAGL